MTTSETYYLYMVLVSVAAFMVTLLWVSRGAGK